MEMEGEAETPIEDKLEKSPSGSHPVYEEESDKAVQ